MRMSLLFGKRIKEIPKAAETASHIFLIRGGYVRPLSTGIYALLPIAKRIVAKIERILREEMDRIDGQEILMPLVLPRDLWEESGRYATVGQELLRFKDRNEKDLVLGMTHEEAAVHIARTEVTSYRQLPFTIYQIQTKYRDEARPRAGMIRAREFTMKDAYSFHANAECLDRYYERVYEAYFRIFKRLGMKDVLAIQSDSGMMGGSVSHEFMAVADCGEDTIFMSPDGKYKANRDIATTAIKFNKEEPLPIEKVHTPECKTIEEVASCLGINTDKTGKVVFYSDANGSLILVMIRGDIDVNETKLKNHLKVSEINYANEELIRAIGCEPGYASPLNINTEKVRIILDPSVSESSNLVVGANELDYHLKNFNFERDLNEYRNRIDIVDIATAREGDPCPVTDEPLIMKRGIEVGNIFKLGTKYTEAMKCLYLDQTGKLKTMLMGCYGIGVGRAMAAIIEQSHDKYGPIWPLPVAPWQVHLCALNLNKNGVHEAAEKIYRDVKDAGIEIIYDDRNEKAGSAFNDADLMGIPLRLIVSPKNLDHNQVEFKKRNGTESFMISIENVVQFLKDRIKKECEIFKEPRTSASSHRVYKTPWRGSNRSPFKSI